MKSCRKYRRNFRNYCTHNMATFMRETSLHGFKFLPERSLSFWEKIFFFLSIVAAVTTTANLITNIYAKWVSTPVIIGISPQPTSILNIPFPAITICNMNQVMNSKVSHYTEDSFENAVLKALCLSELQLVENINENVNDTTFINNTIKISDFVEEHSQPCTRLLLRCEMASIPFNCSLAFKEVITDEGICCVFNILHSDYLFKGNTNRIEALPVHEDQKAVNWNPETGYPKKLPTSYYPTPAMGTGISMGLSIIVNAEIDEYYCSSTNGPGFKISLHNPVETPQMKETGLTVPIGFETRFRIEAHRDEAMPTLRGISQKSRQCIFDRERKLVYYSFYTQQNCERECQIDHILNYCQCIPYNLPLIYNNASVCSIKDSLCINEAKKLWSNDTSDTSDAFLCRSSCLPNCFDLSFQTVSSMVPLVKRNYVIPSELIRGMPKDYANTNVAVIHFYYSKSVFYGNLKNIYIGLTEFLSNTGGIMGLFMGFSFISLAEIFYYAFLRPLFAVAAARKKHKRPGNLQKRSKEASGNWLGEEIYNPTNKRKLYKPSNKIPARRPRLKTYWTK